MLRSLTASLLLLAYLLVGLAGTVAGVRVPVRVVPAPYTHSAVWHRLHQERLDCWDRCNGDQHHRAPTLAAALKTRADAPPPRFQLDLHAVAPPVVVVPVPVAAPCPVAVAAHPLERPRLGHSAGVDEPPKA